MLKILKILKTKLDKVFKCDWLNHSEALQRSELMTEGICISNSSKMTRDTISWFSEHELFMDALLPKTVWVVIIRVLFWFCWVSEVPHECYRFATHVQFCHGTHLLRLSRNQLFLVSFASCWQNYTFFSCCACNHDSISLFLSHNQPFLTNGFSLPIWTFVCNFHVFLEPCNTITSSVQLLMTYNAFSTHQTQ